LEEESRPEYVSGREYDAADIDAIVQEGIRKDMEERVSVTTIHTSHSNNSAFLNGP